MRRLIAGVLRSRLAPLVVWLACAALALSLAEPFWGGGEMLGLARQRPVSLSPARRARIQEVLVAVGDRVLAGQTLARLDASEADAALRVARAEALAAEADVVAARSAAAAAALRARAPLEAALEDALVDESTARARTRAAEERLRAVSAERARLEEQRRAQLLRDPDALVRLTIDEAMLRREVEDGVSVHTLHAARVAGARARVAALPDAAREVAEAVLPLERRHEAALARVAALEAERAGLELRAPVAGVVADVLHRAGEVVDPAVPVLTLETGPTGEVVAYAPESRAPSVRVGDRARVRPSLRAGGPFEGRVVALGPDLVEVPPRLRANPRALAYGRSVVIALEGPTDLLAGEAVTVRLGAAE